MALTACERSCATTYRRFHITAVSVGLPADALRVLRDPGVSGAAIHDETLGDQLLDLTNTALTSG
jgi:hypothetical protein